ncbi:2-hydroxyacid dehydrogenase [Streptantibioticus rubrisoli]|uniref:2-hydroxyacid dehydrogenase n=1 Tax=Streptantibioticus rubrisoli TaxID=1387313 RepID=A0ABT1PGC8_9ACTN|nr:2-hydroxyacid dehydrogenase [Streptantibioticus rubrisoli]MCQ4044421.1 2-hydroxyacid dehydrogenase [Streptantibioticus rubrisoli]
MERSANTPVTVWLPIDPATIDGLPEGPRYLWWDGEDEYPADPRDIDFYVPPYMRGAEVATRPLRHGARPSVVQTLTAGIDHVQDEVPRGTVLCNARGVHDASTAELAVTLTLASLRGIPRFVRGQDSEKWYAGMYPALADRRVVIVGYGAIGAAIEDRLTPFECEVVRVARSARQEARGPVRAMSDLPELLPRADVVILVTPLTEETRYLVDAEFLARMPDGALLVNVGRGAVVDTKALLAELESGRLTAALDVTDPEPLPAGHPLWHAPGVLISPHVGGSSSAFPPRAQRLLREQLRRYLTGEPLRNIVSAPEPPKI